MSIVPLRLSTRLAQPQGLRAVLARAVRALSRRPANALLIDPKPAETRVCYMPDGSTTAIFRRWNRGDSGPSGSCTRCFQCYAYSNACLMTVPGRVARSQAADYSPARSGQPLRGT